ncbi:DUF559 domain-containing protein [Thermoleophilia bacterium SCSIO 60948]|nr:DUF559 domain-containing protein [Thermoleophilia bacterium SCSIO 60948]
MGGEPRRRAGGGQWAKAWELARGQHHAVGREQLFEEEIGRARVDGWLRDGRLVLVHRGVYLVASPVEPPLARHSAALLSCGPRSAIGFWDAARLHGLPLGDPARRETGAPIEVVIAGPRRGRRAGISIHHTATLKKSDVAEVEGLRVTGAARTIRDLAPEATRRRLERMVAEALCLELFEEDEFARQVHASSFPGVGKLRALLDDPGGARMTRSEGESVLLAAIDAAGLPRPATQYRIRGCEFDFVWPRERVVLELDGSAHRRSKTRQRDDHKALVLVEAGWAAPIHVTGSRLRSEPDRIMAAVAAALAVADRANTSPGPARARPDPERRSARRVAGAS